MVGQTSFSPIFSGLLTGCERGVIRVLVINEKIWVFLNPSDFSTFKKSISPFGQFSFEVFNRLVPERQSSKLRDKSSHPREQISAGFSLLFLHIEM